MSRKPRKNYTPAEKVPILRRHLLEKTPVSDLCDEYHLAPTLFYQWQRQFFEQGAAAFERKGTRPRATGYNWLEPWEKEAIVNFHQAHPEEGYRRLTYMMLDRNIVAASAANVYRVLKQAGRLDREWQKPSRKGTGFVQPLAAHEHRHVDVGRLNIHGAFYHRRRPGRRIGLR